MLTLSLLLSAAAAGVNAIGGGEISSVMLNETSFLCPNNCVFGGAFFTEDGYFCPEREVVATLDENGKDNPHRPFDCIELEKKHRFTFRPRSSGEEPPKCWIYEVKGLMTPEYCPASKSSEDGTKTVQWSDIEKELSAAAPPKSQRECAEDGQKIFAKCREDSGEFDECNEKGAASIKKCLGVQ
ncbi:hypothetical protein MY4824_004861 [Beauveria thailandica]